MTKQSPKDVVNLRKKYHKIAGEEVAGLKRRSEIEAVLLSRSVTREDFTTYSDIELNESCD